ncbi:transcription factor SPEECHLESS-like [Bidens hawaiensis]|uniref:transcription factor SPEECHLESS-like n=1 Tax=Bidens hawaiensis TaxID=980011 RepID=UPI00404AEF3A
MAQKLTSLTDFFDGYIEQFADTTNFTSTDIFNTLEGEFSSMESRFHAKEVEHPTVSQKSNANLQLVDPEVETLNSPKSKRQKLSPVEDGGGVSSDGQPKVSHITVERNRRKQMNEHLTVLRSLMPCFYVKRGDQASIIGGVVDYITELQQVLQSLEAKKQRKVYSDVLSPRPSSLSPRKPPLSPGALLPISPRTPQPMSPYRPKFQQLSSSYLQPSSIANLPSPSSSSSNSDFIANNDLVANSKSSIADVEVKFLGSNLVLKTISPRLPGQATKIVSVLEDLSLEILQAGINTVDETMVNSFTIKIGIECQLSAEDLVQHIQQTFC